MPVHSTPARVHARAAELGVEVVDSGDTIELLAPRGMKFAGPGTHMTVADRPWDDPAGIPRTVLWGWCINDMAAGLEACEEYATGRWCDYCSPDEPRNEEN